ncbi:LysR family transcriptional regulator [Pigmentiphaga soli]|uniref:LysR family transcriptional regulator n=1 Tax=Pigmentiphaga soli TaxID=1007095 RepID=A0ABP8GGZ6_9BURK
MSNNIKYRQIKAFAHLVETGTFMAAADLMSVTQPSLSVLIQELERDVGVRLFVRTTRRVEPTPEGRAFYEQIKGSIDQLEEAYSYIKDVGQGSRGRLRVACLSSLAAGVVTNALRRFQERHPQVRVTLCERGHDQVPKAVRNGEVDLGIGTELRADAELVFQRVFNDQLMIVVPAGHELVGRRVTWRSLNPFALILVTPGPASRALQMSNASVSPAFEVEHAVTAMAMVRARMGVTVLPSSVQHGVDTRDLKFLPIPGPLAVRSLGIIRKRNAAPSAAVSDFIALLSKAA